MLCLIWVTLARQKKFAFRLTGLFYLILGCLFEDNLSIIASNVFEYYLIYDVLIPLYSLIIMMKFLGLILHFK